jgi:hypothetical protein
MATHVRVASTPPTPGYFEQYPLADDANATLIQTGPNLSNEDPVHTNLGRPGIDWRSFNRDADGYKRQATIDLRLRDAGVPDTAINRLRATGEIPTVTMPDYRDYVPEPPLTWGELISGEAPSSEPALPAEGVVIHDLDDADAFPDDDSLLKPVEQSTFFNDSEQAAAQDTTPQQPVGPRQQRQRHRAAGAAKTPWRRKPNVVERSETAVHKERRGAFEIVGSGVRKGLEIVRKRRTKVVAVSAASVMLAGVFAWQAAEIMDEYPSSTPSASSNTLRPSQAATPTPSESITPSTEESHAPSGGRVNKADEAVKSAQAAKPNIRIVVDKGDTAWNLASQVLRRQGDSTPEDYAVRAVAASLLHSVGLRYNEGSQLDVGTTLTTPRAGVEKLIEE